ncbi:myosin-8 isoform X3 [Daucus carota subsp. sativus]|uniref:myosin-8 isoform X3 n=1 Tax=Daucus carota subsp. sativus TaxID=79200 RepID=UPI003082E522
MQHHRFSRYNTSIVSKWFLWLCLVIRVLFVLDFREMTTSKTVVVGSHVWVDDPEVAWKDGDVTEVRGDVITVRCTSGEKVVRKISTIFPKDTELPSNGVDDMTKLTYLDEPGVLQNLSCRFGVNEIYTYTGRILIAVNPFQRLPHLYEKDLMKQYKGAALHDLSPHPFAIADSAYKKMIDEGISQSILVSGESGAGKTESTKMLMQYLAYMGGKAAADGRSVEQQVLQSNPVLEAFGNAKTVRNNNSSRFGKFVEIQFNDRGKISGAAIRTYLLERSRVCQVSDPERNYHCFYMICAAPPEDAERYKVGNPRTYHYLNQSKCIELDAMDDSKEYVETKRAMNVVGIGPDEQDAIFRVVAAVLHLGNIEFKKGGDSDSSTPKDDQSRLHLKTAAELFMCDEKSLEDSLCKRVIVTRGEAITKHLDPAAAAISRDALAKTVYSRLFDWIVKKINDTIGQDPGSKYLIGVLDIYGFESFKTNSFEQFCINLTNEKLQQHFNQHVFKMEQEEYKKEAIDWSYIEFVDNQDILDLIEKKPGGIIALLDEACILPRSTHKTFAEKLYQTFSSHKRFKKPKFSQTDFTICHYAGDVCTSVHRSCVTYQSEFFLDKNKDYVIGEHQDLMSASRSPFVSGLFPPLPVQSSNKSKFSSIGSRFKQQLQSLLETLSATEPHYVRCIKPNNLLKPGIFENKNALHQLQCGGVMEAIRISRAGFPTRKTFDEFKTRFRLLEPDILGGRYDEVTACKKLLEKTGLKGYQVGKTKVFLRAGQMAELDAHLTELLGKSAIIIQSKFRSYHAHRDFTRLRFCVIPFQTYCRRQVARQRYETAKRLVQSAINIQAGIRGMSARLNFRTRKQTKAAKMQVAKGTGPPQAASAKIKLEPKSNLEPKSKLDPKSNLEPKSKLEQEVEELTGQLQLEKRMRAEETEKLKSDLEKMRLQFQGGKVSGFPIGASDNEVINALTAENEKLKSQVNTLENRIIQLKTDMQRLEEKLSDIEVEGHVLRQQTVQTGSPTAEGQEHIEDLIRCVTKNVGFSQKKPVAAVTMFRCLMQWKSFEADRSRVFDILIQMIGSKIEDEGDNELIIYWYSNTSTLLFLLQRSFKTKTQPTGFFGRMTQGFLSSPSDVGGTQEVEPKYPAIRFKQQLTAYVEKIYTIVRNNLKKELSPSLDYFTQVHPVLVQKIFTQTFSYINVKIFNSFLLHQECCSLVNGEFLEAGLGVIELWCDQAALYAGSSWDELTHIRQAVGFLAMQDKSKVTYTDLTNNLCPGLSVQQLHRICTLVNSNGKKANSCVSADIFSQMKKIMTADVDVNSLLLDDNSSIPVTVDELNDPTTKVEGISDVEPPSELVELEAFKFLKG